jgi:tripartite-type tricarboxylate transporter receptor subunit TctC
VIRKGHDKVLSARLQPAGHRLRGLAAGFCLLPSALCLGIAGAEAQQYPVRPIRFVVPFAPGGSTDLVARLLAARLPESLGQSVVVDNRPGAGGVVGAEIAARAPADGYTMLLGSPGPLTINPGLQSKVPYDTLRDFSPITLVTVSPFTLVLHPSVAAASVRDLIALAKAKPGQLNYGSAGNGSVGHFAAEQFKALAGVDLVHVPYKGAGPAVNDLLGGRLHVMFENLPTIVTHVRAGKLRMLAVGTRSRSALVPEYPTMQEAGVPGYEQATAFGVLFPAKTPAALVARMNRDVRRVLDNPEVRERLSAQGLEAAGGTPRQYAAHLEEELARYARIAKAAGIRIE